MKGFLGKYWWVFLLRRHCRRHLRHPRLRQSRCITLATLVLVWGAYALAGDDRQPPVNLLEQQDPYQPVGPGHGTEALAAGWRGRVSRGMAVGTADDEGHVLRPAIEVAAQEIGKGFAGHGLAAFVKHDAEGP